MKFLIIKRQHIMLALCVIVATIILVVGSVGILASQNRKLPIYCVQTNKKQVAISFDAAWGNDDTETLIKILKQYDVPATFFVVGAWVDKYPESVEALHKAGHRIENHSNTHPHMPQLSKQQIINEIESCNTKIKAVTGRCPTLIRVPYGDYDNAVLQTVEELGMYTIQWDVDSLDWKNYATAESICKRVTSKVKNGSIVLFHNDADHTPEALPNILKCLKDEGYEFVFIEDLIYKENYEIIHDGTQCKLQNN